jgi:uncharacterized membrane protein
MQMALPQQRNEPLRNAAVRSAGYWITLAGFAGFAIGMTQEWLQSIDRGSSRDLGLRRLPAALVSGAMMAAVVEYRRRRRESIDRDEAAYEEEAGISGVRSLGFAVAASAGLGAFAATNRLVALALGSTLDFLLPGDERIWRPVGRLASLGLIGAGLTAGLHRVNVRIEEGAGKIEQAFGEAPASRFVSGGPGSLVSWETLSREGRRHVVTYVRSEWIADVMGEPAMEPIRVYVGLDSAPTQEDRVRLAIAELERTGAFDRDLLIAVSPTGTGYVNYVAIEAAEYMSRGNCATVTIQYSKRPSPLSLDRVWQGRQHFRMLISAIRRTLYQRAPEDRPRLVVFGESLGAHTSQDAFLNQGTIGLQDAGVERALWIGTPHLSSWRTQVFGKERPDVELEQVSDFDNFEQLEAMDPEQRSKLRYFLITHGNDGVGHFGPDLLIQQPVWLGEPETRPPRVPKGQKWSTPTTFVQTLIDMNNAMNVVPGVFEASGHDYRSDLARFVREAYGLSCSEQQLANIEAAMRRSELQRQALLDAQAALAAAEQGQDASSAGATDGANEQRPTP